MPKRVPETDGPVASTARDDGYVSDLSPGQIALGAALMRLPRHPLDARRAHPETDVVRSLAWVPDRILLLLAEEIAPPITIPKTIDEWFSPRRPPPLPTQPRLAEIERMVFAAMRVSQKLDGLRSIRGPRSRRRRQ